MVEAIRRYGVHEQVSADDAVARAVEDIRLLGFAVVDGGYSEEELDAFSAHFDGAREAYAKTHGGHDVLRAIDEHNTVRALLGQDKLFIDLARNASVMQLCGQLLGQYFILNQQNGIINPPHGERYNQGAFHRDLPYQHFTSSRPLAINALFCLDAFTSDNGSTLVIPASHKQEAFPSDRAVNAHSVRVTAPRGSFIVLDCMVYHSGGSNLSDKARRAVNHVYTIPLLRQQIDLPTALGFDFAPDSDVAQFLGYSVRTPSTVSEYIADRKSYLGGASK